MIFQGLQNRYDYITAKLTEIERELPHLPPGRLICGFYKGHPKYYLSCNKVRTYLSSKDATLIQQLSYKKYLLALQKDLLAEKKALSPYIEYQPAGTLAALCSLSAYFLFFSRHFGLP